MILRELLEQGAARLAEGPHPTKARLDAETLLLHQTGKERAWLISHLDDDFAGCRAIGYAALLDRRVKGEPIQYIVGECEFYGLPFRVTGDVLIPRPETELLVEKALVLGRRCEEPRIVDVGTGSGAIPVALAHHLSSAQIAATDISQAALAIAKENAERNQVAHRIRFLQGDLLTPVGGEVFDLVLSNPPYVSVDERGALAIEVRDHEPEVALFAGGDGLAIYRRLIPAARAVLVRGGYVALEIGYGQEDPVRHLLQSAGFGSIECAPDLRGIPRVVVGCRV
jgi:release factor glutamine methyltransferase